MVGGGGGGLSGYPGARASLESPSTCELVNCSQILNRGLKGVFSSITSAFQPFAVGALLIGLKFPKVWT